MSNGIIGNNQVEDDTLVIIDENQPVSMKLLQSIYNEITGKTEKLSKRLKEFHKVTFADLEELNSKVSQALEQYQVKAKNCAITLYHIDDQKELFSSFERFKLYNANSNSPCENITIKYNFLIILPELSKPQAYQIEVNLHSNIAIEMKAKGDGGDLFHARLKKILSRISGDIEIEHVDNMVARNFMGIIEDWYSGVEKNPSSWLVTKAQKLSLHLPFFFRASTTFFLILSIYLYAESANFVSFSQKSMFIAGLITFGAIFLASQIAYKLGAICEIAIDTVSPGSVLILNKGDNKAIQNFKKANSMSWIKVFGSTLGIIALNLISNHLTSYFGLP